MTMSEDRFFEDVAAYVLGALDADEAAELRVHLEGCARCRAEAARLGAVTEALGRAVPPLAAPPELRRRVLDAVAAEAPARAPVRRARPSLLGRRPLAAAAVALALAAGLLVGALAIAPGSPPVRTVTASVAPAARWHAARAPAATLRVTGAAGLLVVRGLPAPPAGRIYEVWVVRSGRPVATDALFDAARSGTATVAVPGSLRGASAVLVTAERLGGASAPTMAPLIAAGLG